jgi:hypothetical protein
MNDITGYTFFRSYHESLNGLDKADKKDILEAMDDFIFEDIEPCFEGVKKSIWILIRPTLSTSKIRSRRGKAKTNQNKIKTKSKRELSPPYPYPNNTNTVSNNLINKNNYLDYVLLTEEEYKKLVDRFGEEETNNYITKLNNYIGSKGKKYKSHYFTILNWLNKDKPVQLVKGEPTEWDKQ